jgi:hypothetical protein
MTPGLITYLQELLRSIDEVQLSCWVLRVGQRALDALHEAGDVVCHGLAVTHKLLL